MKRKSLALAVCSVALIGCGKPSIDPKSSQKSVQHSPIVGDWSGILDLGIMKVTLVLHIQQETDGALSATIDCLEQKMLGMPIDSITSNEGVLKFENKAILIQFEGNLINESEITGQFFQSGQPFSMAFERGIKAIAAPNRPQEPKLPYPYAEELVAYDNPAAGVILSGTLTLPSSNGPFPVVLLIAGSGPNDRDETIFGHKPFLVLADHLTRQGIAVLRVDKRGCGTSSGDYKKSTGQNFADDVLAGIEYLKTRKEINPNQIGLIGHSEGASLAPLVAAKSKDVAFIVLLAGAGVNGEEILYEQGALIQRKTGASEETIEQNRKLQKQMYSIVIKEPNAEIALGQLREFINSQNHPSPDALLEQAKTVNSPWYRFFLKFDPATALKHVNVPVLALNGELDVQVTPTQNLPAIAKALEESGNKDYNTVELPKLNHLFQTCQTGLVAEYAEIEETIAPKVLDLISDWIQARTKGGLSE